jgi:glycosyltransferase involved in cell wall biosynthesis
MRKISVIIPCYNVASYVDRCITSIVVQTIGIDNLEIICIDDASTDHTWEHLQKWEQKFPENILLIRQEVNRRQGAARNVGLQYASADWVAFVDADDWLEPDYFEQLYIPAERFACDVAACGIETDYAADLVYFKEEDREKGKDQYIQSDTNAKKKEMLICKPLGEGPWAKIIRKELLLKYQIFFPEELFYEDNFWIPLLHIYVHHACVIGKKLYHYFVNPQSTIYKKNESYHVDWITIQLRKWRDYGERGLFKLYREELECDLLYNAVCFMKTLILRYDQPSFSYYQLEKQLIQQRIPDYKTSPYANIFTGIAGVLLDSLYLSMNKKEFQEFTGKVKQYYALNGKMQAERKDSGTGNGFRIVMFYSETESFNFFTDQLRKEFEKRGHEVFICDLEDTEDKTEHSYSRLNQFISKKVDLVICFDGLGTREDQFIEQWNRHQAVVVDILMDPPFRFHPTLEKHPEKYQLFCCDLEHVKYVKKYFAEEVPAVAFMPHVGTLGKEDVPVIPYEMRKYDILFSGSYAAPESYLEKIPELFPDDPRICRLYRCIYDLLLKDSSLTIEEAVLGTLNKNGWSVSDSMLKTLLNRSLYVDWAVRMYYRGQVVSVLAEAGFDLYLLGQGWEAHPSIKHTNVHRIEGKVPYEKSLAYMADAKLNLNVMPWFKAGTHDRIFNTLLRHSLPLTDPSSWIAENFTGGGNIALYDLDHLECLPEIVHELLEDSVKAETMIQKGYEMVRQKFTWTNCADWILDAAKHYPVGEGKHG